MSYRTSARLCARYLKIVVWLTALTVWGSGSAAAQTAAAASDTTSTTDSVVVAPLRLPVFVTLGIAYGMRSDPCSHCAAPENTESFSGHISVGRYLVGGLGVGVDASVWRRGHPGPPGPADSTGAPTSTSLANMLGNASLTFSYQVWHVYVRAGGGIAWGSQDVLGVDAGGGDIVIPASGLGIGYSVGAGITLPVASLASLVFFGNWNAGQYDLTSVSGVLERDAKHEYLELGVGITVR